MKDFKEFYIEACDDIADREHSAAFYDLPAEVRDAIGCQATDEATDNYSAMCDAVYEQVKDRQLFGG